MFWNYGDREVNNNSSNRQLFFQLNIQNQLPLCWNSKIFLSSSPFLNFFSDVRHLLHLSFRNITTSLQFSKYLYWFGFAFIWFFHFPLISSTISIKLQWIQLQKSSPLLFKLGFMISAGARNPVIAVGNNDILTQNLSWFW